MKLNLGKLTLTGALCAIALSGNAVVFDTTTVGGTATVGTSGDYASMVDAAAAFSALPSPFLQGNWKLEILNDLTEPANAGFGNTVPSGSSLTIKPADGTSVTLTFTNTVDNAGPSGNLLIGVKGPTIAWTDLAPTNNVTIDGSNNGTDSRNLTVINTVAVTHTFCSPIAVVGAADNIIVKNLYVHNVAASTGSSVTGITVAMRFDGTNFHVPGAIKIQNTEMLVRNGQGHGVNYRFSSTGTVPAIVPTAGQFEISNCYIESRLRGIFLDIGINGLIDSNVIRVGAIGPAVNGFLQQGVGVNNARSATGQVLNVTNNEIFMQSGNVSAGNFGPAAFNLVTGGTGNTVNFVNNMLNFRFTSTATANGIVMSYLGFRGTSALTYNILQNSINMPDFANLTGLVRTGTSGITGAIKLPETVSYTANIKNNIVRVGQSGSAGLLTQMSAGTGTIVSDNNVIYRDNANTVTGLSGTVATPVVSTTLAEWKTNTSLDTNSIAVDPLATAGSKWEPSAVNADLHFVPSDASPTGITRFAKLAEVATDIDGQSRALTTLPGADEIYNANVSGWSLY